VNRSITTFVLAVVLALLAGCAPGPSDQGEPRVVIVASAASTEFAPELPAGLLAELRATGGDRRWERRPGTGTAVVSLVGDPAVREFVLVPRRDDGSVERGLQRAHLLDQNVDDVASAVAELAGPGGDLDLLDALARTVRGLDGGLLVVLSNGLSTAGGLDLRQVRWLLDADEIADGLAERGLLPDLTGWRVVFVGLGSTTGAQVPLDEATYRRLVGYWTTICLRAGGTGCNVEAASGTRPSRSLTPATLVPVPGVTSVTAPDGTVTATVSTDLLGFAGDSATISQAGAGVLDGLAAQIRASGGRAVSVRGYAADPPGSTPEGIAAVARARSESVVLALGARGVSATSLGGSRAPGPSSVQDGRFDESRATEMRHVTITYES
jgi:hypothetical protein